MGSKVNANDELRCYSAAWPYVELFPPHASCGMYNVSQASSATGFIRPVHTHCIDSTRPNNTSVIFLTHSVNVRRRRWYFWLALSFFYWVQVHTLSLNWTAPSLTTVWPGFGILDFIDLKIKIDQYREGGNVRQHYRLIICIESVELTNSAVSDDKIQVTILILRRGALSNWVQWLPFYSIIAFI